MTHFKSLRILLPVSCSCLFAVVVLSSGLATSISPAEQAGNAASGSTPSVAGGRELGRDATCWRWSWTSATGRDESVVRLSPDGVAKDDGPKKWGTGKWRKNGSEIWIDWGEGAKRGNWYYIKLVPSADGNSMSISPSQKNGNYYLRTIKVQKVDCGPESASEKKSSSGTTPPLTASVPGDASGAGLAGSWIDENTVYGKSTFTLTSIGNRRYRYQQFGFGNATGTAEVVGDNLRIDWTTKDGWAGYAEYELARGRPTGKGKAVITKGVPRSFATTIRPAEVSATPATGSIPSATGGGKSNAKNGTSKSTPAPSPGKLDASATALAGFGKPHFTFEAIKYPPPPLPLPPVGAERKSRKSADASEFQLLPVMFGSAAGRPPRIVNVSARRQLDPNQLDWPGELIVEVASEGEGLDHHVIVYVGGFLAYVDRKTSFPGYGCGSTYSGGSVAFSFKMPRVLPARIRAEVYPYNSPNPPSDTREITFNHPFPDLSIERGSTFGEESDYRYIMTAHSSHCGLTGEMPKKGADFEIYVPQKRFNDPWIASRHVDTLPLPVVFDWRKEPRIIFNPDWENFRVGLTPSDNCDSDWRNNFRWAVYKGTRGSKYDASRKPELVESAGGRLVR